MKELPIIRNINVFKITANGEFKQYLKLSEIRFLRNMCTDFGLITVEIISMPKNLYDLYFH